MKLPLQLWHAWAARQFKQRLRHLRQKTAAFEDFGVPSSTPVLALYLFRYGKLVMKDFVRTTFTTSDGVNLSYLRARTRLPVILLHSFMGSGSNFKRQPHILAEQ